MKLEKYLKIFKINLSNHLEYRINFIFSFFISLFSLGTNILLWIAAINEKESIKINKSYILSYYFIMLIVANITTSNSLIRIANEIRSGDLDKHLIKPYNYILYNLMADFSYRATFIVMNSIPIFLFYILYNKYLVLYTNKISLFCFILFLIIGYLINYLIDFLIALFSFYFSKITSFYVSIKILRNILAGSFFPLGILPKEIMKVFNNLPFMYTTYIPVKILTEKIENIEIFYFLRNMFIYFFILLVFSIYLWKKGKNIYTSYGG